MPKPKPVVYLHGRFYDGPGLAHVILSVNGQRWEYHLNTQQADTVEHLCKHISARKALLFARSRSIRQIKL